MIKAWKIRLSCAAGILFVLALIAYIPVTHHRVITRGVDTFETHRPLFDSHTQSQIITSYGPLLEIGAILVDLRRSDNITDVTIDILDPDSGQSLGSTVIPASDIKDDRFASGALSSPVSASNDTLLLKFSAQSANSSNPVGIRFNNKAVGYSRIEDGEETEGTLAVAATERIPIWRFLQLNVMQYTGRWRTVGLALGLSLLTAVLAVKLGWNRLPKQQTRAIELGLLLVIAALSFNSRMAVINRLTGVSGGDPYNYLNITNSIVEGKSPFVGAKRLPGLPLLLIPAYLTDINDPNYMKTISALSAAGIIVMLGLLSRQLGLPWAVTFSTAIILAWQKDFFWTSSRPEPYSLFAFLLLVSLVLFFSKRTKWQQLAFGFLLGYAAMTRQEGFVLAAILGVAFWVQVGTTLWQDPQQWSKKIRAEARVFLWMFVPALVIVFPFFVHNAIEYGNPLFTPYFEGERLQIVDSPGAFIDAINSTWGVLGSMWKPIWKNLDRYPLYSKLAIYTYVTTLLWFGSSYTQTWWKKAHFAILGTLLLPIIGYVAWLAIAQKSTFGDTFPPVVAAMMLVAFLPFLFVTKWKGFLVFLVIISQVLIPTWFHPFPKHYQQVYPFIALFLATTALIPLSINFKKHQSASITFFHFSLITAMVLPFIFVALYLFEPRIQTALIDKHNAATALDSVVFRAVEYSRHLSGLVGFEQEYQQANLYYKDRAVYFPAEEFPTKEQEQAWLNQYMPQYMVVTNNDHVFTSIPATWHQLASFKTEGRDERLFESRVYTTSL